MPPKKQKPSKRPDTATLTRAAVIAAARAVLEEKYERIYGCRWDLTPWGRPWRDVLTEVHAADHAYKKAQAALEALAKSVDDAVALIGGYARLDELRRREVDSYDMALIVGGQYGWTLPDAMIAAACVNGGGQLLELRRTLDEYLARLEVSTLQVARATIEQTQRDFGRTEDKGEGDQPESIEQRSDPLGGANPYRLLPADSRKALANVFHESMRRRGSRRLGSVKEPWVMPSGARRNHFGPGIQGRAPRVLEGAEWRRATLAALLDTYPLRLDAELVADIFPTDGEIAVVSLLIDGALDEYSTTELSRVPEALNAERKAIALTRSRHGALKPIVAGMEAKSASCPADAPRPFEHPLDGEARLASITRRATRVQELVSEEWQYELLLPAESDITGTGSDRAGQPSSSDEATGRTGAPAGTGPAPDKVGTTRPRQRGK